MKDLIKKVEKLGDDVERLQSLQNASGGGGGTVTGVSGTAPIVSSGGTAPAISLANSGVTAGSYTNADVTVDIHGLVTAIANGSAGSGTVALQATTPGTQQTGNINVSSRIKTAGDVIAGTLIQAQTTIQAVSGPYYLGFIPILDSGTTFPSSPVDLQRYRHETYRSWFVYNGTDAKWRQEAPGVFGSSFPTVSSGDNTVAPNIEVKRIDRSNEVYFWNGANWLTVKIYPAIFSVRVGGPASATISVSTSAVNNGTHPDNSSDVFITTITTNLFPNGTNNGSNYWIAQFRTRNSSGTATNTYTGNTSAGTTLTIIPIVITVNAIVTKANFYDVVQDVNTSGSPGTVNFYPAIMNCRLVG